MATIIEQHALEALTPEERLELAEALWESVPPVVANEPVDPIMVAELRRRSALSKADPTRGIPGEDVLAAARLRSR